MSGNNKMTHRATSIDLAPIRTLAPDALHYAALLKNAGGEAFLVGGCVRDVLLGKTPGDVDLATNLTPQKVSEVLTAAKVKVIPTGLQHGTVTAWTTGGHGTEITTYRTDGTYSDGRRPDSVAFVTSLEADLARRDFTVNAMAADPETGALRDPFDGAGDLDAKIIRAVGNPLHRFQEDGLRTMRAVRFATRLGFAIDPATLAAITKTLEVTAKVAIERLRDELVKMLQAEAPSVGLHLMHQTQLLALVLPELKARQAAVAVLAGVDPYAQTFAAVDAATTPVARLAALFVSVPEQTDAAMLRLRFSNEERELVVRIVRQVSAEPDTDADVRRFVGVVGARAMPHLLDLRRALGKKTTLEQRIGEVLASGCAVRVADLAINGDDVMRALGIGPSRRVRDLLDRLLEQVLQEPGLNAPDTLLKKLKEME